MFRSLILLLAVFAGIGRHDVSLDEYRTFAKDPAFSGVGAFRSAGATLGSGTLISEGWVLTAHHVIAPKPDLREVRFVLGSDTVPLGRTVSHPGANGSFDRIDLILVELSRPISDVQAVSFFDDDFKAGTEAAFVGWGHVGSASMSPEDLTHSGTRTAGMNVLDSLGPPSSASSTAYPSSYAIADFDSPREDSNRIGSPTPLPLEYQSYKGDSGGAVFVRTHDEWQLAGVLSAIDYRSVPNGQHYGALTKAVWLAPLVPWIEAEIAKGR